MAALMAVEAALPERDGAGAGSGAGAGAGAGAVSSSAASGSGWEVVAGSWAEGCWPGLGRLACSWGAGADS